MSFIHTNGLLAGLLSHSLNPGYICTNITGLLDIYTSHNTRIPAYIMIILTIVCLLGVNTICEHVQRIIFISTRRYADFLIVCYLCDIGYTSQLCNLL